MDGWDFLGLIGFSMYREGKKQERTEKKALQRQKQAAEQQEKRQKEYSDFLEKMVDAVYDSSEKLMSEISALLTSCGNIDLEDTFVEDVKLAPFYAISEVLSTQGKIHSRQEDVLKQLVFALNPRFNYGQLTQAAIFRRDSYQDFRAAVGLDASHCGSFWLKLFELVYRTRKTDKVQVIYDCMANIAMNFALISEEESPYLKDLCQRMNDHLNFHVKAYQRTPYIHALVLLQVTLAQKLNMGYDTHCLKRIGNKVSDGSEYYVFQVYKIKDNALCDTFAVREITFIDQSKGTYDYDRILRKTGQSDIWELFYQTDPDD